MITVEGDERAEAVILRAGRRAQDQSSSLREAGQAASSVASPGSWQNRTGSLAQSVEAASADASADSLRMTSDVPYARFVWYGTSRQSARPPHVEAASLAAAVARRVANDLVGE